MSPITKTITSLLLALFVLTPASWVGSFPALGLERPVDGAVGTDPIGPEEPEPGDPTTDPVDPQSSHPVPRGEEAVVDAPATAPPGIGAQAAPRAEAGDPAAAPTPAPGDRASAPTTVAPGPRPATGDGVSVIPGDGAADVRRPATRPAGTVDWRHLRGCEPSFWSCAGAHLRRASARS